MITNFEDITYDLTDYERRTVLPLIVSRFFILKSNERLLNDDIQDYCKDNYASVTSARVRKVINYIRNKNLIPGLVASSKGYYITSDPGEIKRYIESLDGRIEAIKSIKEKMEVHYRKITKGVQKSLF